MWDLVTKAKTRLANRKPVGVWDIFEWNNLVWFLSRDNGMMYNRGTAEIVEFVDIGTPKGFIKSSLTTETGDLWISVLTDILRFKKSSPLFTTIEIKDPKKTKVRFNNIWQLSQDSSDILVSTSNGLFLLDPNNDAQTIGSKIPELSKLRFLSCQAIDKEHLWIGTFRSGLFHFDRETKILDNYSISQTGEYHINSNFVRHIAVYDIEVFISTNGGLYRYDKVTKHISYVNLIDDDALPHIVTYSLKDKKGRLWVSTTNGLYVKEIGKEAQVFNAETEPALSNNRVRGIYQYSDSIFLIGTSLGLNIYLSLIHI